MPSLTAQKLVDEIQRHIVRHPEAADWPVAVHDDSLEGTAWEVERVVLDLSNGKRRFIVER